MKKKIKLKVRKHIILLILAVIFSVLMYFFPEYFEQFNIQEEKKPVAKDLSAYKEKDFVRDNCTGVIEYKLPDNTRVDCLTEEYAIEFDYAKKWAESIGQAKYYAKMTGKKPAVAIIMKSPDDEKYIKRIRETDSSIVIMKIRAYK